MGRQAQLRQLEKAFAHVCLLVLEGRAGSDKTALALELANRRREAVEQPLLWVRARGGWGVESLLQELERWGRGTVAPVELPLQERVLLWARQLNSQAATLVVDDFHLLVDGWLLLEVMREYLSQGRLLVTTRQAVELAALARVDSAVIRVEALEPAESRQLLDQLLDQHELVGWLEAAQFSALLEAGRGQPLLLKLLVSLLLQNRRATLDDVAAFQDELYTDLVAQLEAQLQDEERQTLRILALLRRPVPAGALGSRASHLPLLLDRLLVERGPGGSWTTHDVFRDVYERTLEPGESRELHATCARYYESLSDDPMLAREAIHHLSGAGQPERARALLLEQATSLYQAAQYDFLLTATAQLADCQEPEATALRILRAEVLAMLGQTHAALELFGKAEQSHDPQLAIRAMNSRCHLLLERGKLEQAQAIAARCLTRLEEMSGRRPGRVKALNAMALALARRGHVRQALETAEKSLTISREIDDPKGACYAHYAAALAHRHASAWQDALAQARLARGQAQESGERRLGFLAGLVEVMALLACEQVEQAHRTAEQAYQRALLYPDPLSQAMAGLGQALSHQARQEYEEAETLMEVALQRAGQHGGRVFLAQLHLSLGLAYQATGNLDSARQRMEQGLALARAADAFPFEADLELQLALLGGQADLPEARFERAQVLGLPGLAARLRLALAADEKRRGRDRLARECLQGVNQALLDPGERDFVKFLRLLLDGARPTPPDGPWRAVARTLAQAASLPYRLTTLDGSRMVGAEEADQLRDSRSAFDLFLDLVEQRAWERERGERPLLRRKVLVRMLLALLRAGGQPLSQEELYLAVWEAPYEAESGGPQVRKNMSALRDLLEPDREAPRYLLVQESAFARKGGYLWSPERSFCLLEDVVT